jgi:molybdate transport system substrate-binding protein
MLLRRTVLTLIAALALAAPAQAQPAITVLAAASLKEVMDAQGAAFTKAGGPPVRFSYAASSALARQVEAGAPADLFISADAGWMDHVAQRRLIVPASRRDLATNRLALIAPRDSRLTLRMGRAMPLAAALGAGGRLAMAAPEVPAGRYGRAALESLGVWASVRDRLAPADSVRGALVFVSRGEAPLGIVYDTDARADPSVRIVALFPAASHPKIVYPGAVLREARHPAAGRFMSFLRTPQAAQIFRAHGFSPLS